MFADLREPLLSCMHCLRRAVLIPWVRTSRGDASQFPGVAKWLRWGEKKQKNKKPQNIFQTEKQSLHYLACTSDMTGITFSFSHFQDVARQKSPSARREGMGAPVECLFDTTVMQMLIS